MRSAFITSFVVLLTLSLVMGCGSSGKQEFRTKGKVHRGETTLTNTSKVPGGSAIEVGFYPVDGGDPRLAIADPNTGEFNLKDRGLAPGKYKVAVHHYDPRPEDKLKGAFSKEKTPITIEVKGDQELDIDLSKYEKK